MEATIEYAAWAGRLSACLESVLTATGSETLDDINREVAAETLADFYRVTAAGRLGRRARAAAHYAALAEEAAADIRTTGDGSAA